MFCLQAVSALADSLLIMPSPTAKAFPFKDVSENAWYYGDVKSAYEMGLINGKDGADTYKPDENMTYAEAAKLAACMNELYTTGKVTLTNGTANWYDTYVEYCKNKGIITKDYDYKSLATRAGYMEVFAKALPDEALKQKNIVPKDFVPDIKVSDAYYDAVYKLYRAGIVAGSDAEYSCNPKDNIKRSEVAAILSRMMDESKRVSVGFEPEKENEMTFGVFSDVHNSKNDFDNVMNTIYALTDEGSQLDGIVMVGDIVYLAAKDSIPGSNTYATIKANPKFSSLLSAGKVVYGMGNHEFPLNNLAEDVTALSKEVFKAETGLDPEKVTVYDGYHFITAGPKDYGNTLTAEQEQFVMDSVNAALKADPIKPVFLILHQPVDATLYGTGSSNKYSDAFETFIKAQPRLIVFSAHMHYPSSDPQTIYQVPGGTTFVYSSCLMGGNGAKPPTATERHRTWPNQGIILRINKDTNVVTLKRFYSGSGVPKYLEGGDWTLDIPAMIDENGDSSPNLDVYKYTNARKELSKAPYFKEDDAITIKELTEYSAKVVIPVPQQGAPDENSVVAFYDIEVYNKTKGEVLKSVRTPSDYFLKSKGSTYTYNLVDLPDSSDFKVSVTPVTAWYVKAEKPLTVEFSTPAPKFPAVNLSTTNVLRYNVYEAKLLGTYTKYADFIHMGYSTVASAKFVVDVTKPGKYRIFLEASAAGSADLALTVCSADVTYTERADGTEKVNIANEVELHNDTVTVNTANVSTFKDVICADMEFTKAGSYTVRFKKAKTPYTIGVKTLKVVEIEP